MARRGLGEVRGTNGHLGTQPFYTVRIAKTVVPQMVQMLSQANRGARCGVSITADHHNPDRLRLSEVDPPAFEASASNHYIRDSLHVSGRNSVNIDMSARFGVPTFVGELNAAATQAIQWIEVSVPTRARNLVEIRPDTAFASQDTAVGEAGVVLAGKILPHEDFADWEGEEKHRGSRGGDGAKK